MKIKYKIELNSEAVISSGLNIEDIADSDNIPYINARIFKGSLREVLQETADILKLNDVNEKINELFGTDENESILKFSHCVLSENVSGEIKKQLKENEITKADILKSFIDTRINVKISENGITEENSLRKIYVIRNGLTFYCTLDGIKGEDESALEVLALGALSLKNLGGKKNRGKGKVKVSLIQDGEDITKNYSDKLKQKAVSI